MSRVGVCGDAVIGQALPDLFELRRAHEKGEMPGARATEGVCERQDRLVAQPDHRERAVVHCRIEVEHLDDVGGGRLPVPYVHDGVVEVGGHDVLLSLRASIGSTTGPVNVRRSKGRDKQRCHGARQPERLSTIVGKNDHGCALELDPDAERQRAWGL
jgi:hypothetical protein